jgi:SRSO17 transposase
MRAASFSKNSMGSKRKCDVPSRQPVAPVVADAGYGVVTAFREALTAQGIPYVVGISTETTVWAPGRAPLAPQRYRGQGRPPDQRGDGPYSVHTRGRARHDQGA